MPRSAIFAALSLLPLLLPLASGSGEKLMQQVCRQTANYDLCMGAYEKNRPDHSLDVKQVTKLSLRMATLNVTKTLRTIQKSTPSERDQGAVKVLNICHNYYEAAKRDVEQAEAAFFKGDYKGTRRIASLAMRQEYNCNQAFKGTSYQQHPVYALSSGDYILTQMAILASQYIRR